MNTSNRIQGIRAEAQHGFTMVEVLVTLAIITVWLLATAGVQSSSLKLNKAAQFRTEAVAAATDIAERIEANKTALAGAYQCGGTNTACIPAGSMPDCSTVA